MLSVDPIEAAIWRCDIPPSFATGVAAHEVADTIAEAELRLGLTVIAAAWPAHVPPVRGERGRACRRSSVLAFGVMSAEDVAAVSRPAGRRDREVLGDDAGAEATIPHCDDEVSWSNDQRARQVYGVGPAKGVS